MDEPSQLLELLIVVAAARLAAEGAERARVPGVVAEIVLGLIIGPSILGLVGSSDVLRFMGEVGVILLLFEVGRQMDIADLRSVGSSSARVAVVGVVAPMALTFAALSALRSDGAEALFLAGALTATSVAVTARTFSELRTLGSPTAGIVLGAAVLDDVLGLMVLTFVSRVAVDGGAGVGSMVEAMVPAIGFLVAALLLGRFIPMLIERLSASSRAEGTVLALGLLLALGFAAAARSAGLAPVVGAFLAGVVIGPSSVAHELHQRLTPVGHLFIPIFFLGVGIQTDPGVFADPRVIGLTALLVAAAVIGKLVSGLGVARASADRLQVGIGMIPRGEVGLVFAGVGLSSGILDARSHAALVGVVIITTLLGPSWLRARIVRQRRLERVSVTGSEDVSRGGSWLRVNGEVELESEPHPALESRVALEASIACSTRRPGPELVRWMTSLNEPIVWDEELRRVFDQLLSVGNARSWRLLAMTGVLRRLLPEVAAAVGRLPRDPFDLEPTGSVPLHVLEGLGEIVGADPAASRIWERLPAKREIRLAALAMSVLAGSWDAGERARALVGSLGVGDGAAGTVAELVADRHLLRAASQRPGMVTEESVAELAAHLGSPERVDALYLLTLAEGTEGRSERSRLEELRELLREALAHPDLTGPSATHVVERRREEVARILARDLDEVNAMLRPAPSHYLLAQEARAVARHLRMLETRPQPSEVRLEADPIDLNKWAVHIAALDRKGFLAAIAGTLAEHETSVQRAELSVWRNGIAVNVLQVAARVDTDWGGVQHDIQKRISGGDVRAPVAPLDATVEFDHLASPWRTVVEMLARDRVGLLHRVASAFDLVGVRVHRAIVTTRDDLAVDTFWVTGRDGGKLTSAEETALRAAFDGRSVRRTVPSWLRRLVRS